MHRNTRVKKNFNSMEYGWGTQISPEVTSTAFLNVLLIKERVCDKRGEGGGVKGEGREREKQQ